MRICQQWHQRRGRYVKAKAFKTVMSIRDKRWGKRMSQRRKEKECTHPGTHNIRSSQWQHQDQRSNAFWTTYANRKNEKRVDEKKSVCQEVKSCFSCRLIWRKSRWNERKVIEKTLTHRQTAGSIHSLKEQGGEETRSCRKAAAHEVWSRVSCCGFFFFSFSSLLLVSSPPSFSHVSRSAEDDRVK